MLTENDIKNEGWEIAIKNPNNISGQGLGCDKFGQAIIKHRQSDGWTQIYQIFTTEDGLPFGDKFNRFIGTINTKQDFAIIMASLDLKQQDRRIKEHKY